MASIFMDSMYKKLLAVNLASNYSVLQKNFVKDSYDFEQSVSGAASYLPNFDVVLC